MSTFSQRVCIWSGVVFMALLMTSFAIAGFIPPPPPTSSPREIITLFTENSLRIRLGLPLLIIGAPLLFSFCAAITVAMRKIEGKYSPLAYTQLVAGVGAVPFFFFPTMIFLAFAYRPEALDPAVVQVLFDFSWLTFLGTPGLAVVQGLAIALCILRDDSTDPVFPRWAGYFNIWVFLLFLPSLLTYFFKTGPFAWNGLFVWWIPLGVFGAWVIVMTVLMLKALNRDDDPTTRVTSSSGVQGRAVE